MRGKGNKEGDRGKGQGSPLERHLEFKEGSLSERGDNEGATRKEGRGVRPIKVREIQIMDSRAGERSALKNIIFVDFWSFISELPALASVKMNSTMT